MPYSVFFNGGIAFHEGSLKAQSHGCVHLSRAAATKFFGHLSVGSTVQVVP
jgi:lipoprotein-anchoring transpeptidase ErfK/SrfK